MSKIKTVEQKKSIHYAVKSVEKPGFFVKDVDTASGVITGFFNSYNYFDSDYDVLMPGCAAKTISASGPNSNAIAKIKHAFMHDLNKLVGKLQVLREDFFTWNGIKVPGIYFESKAARTQLGQDTLKNYQDEIYDNHSIGFRYLLLEYIEKGATGWDQLMQNLINPEDADKIGFAYPVKEIVLYEGSTVAFGANKLTPYLGTKSENKEAKVTGLYKRLDKLTKVISKGTQSDEMLSRFSIHVLQIKQMISELIDGSDALIDPKEQARKKSEEHKNTEKKFNTQEFIKHFSLQ